MALKNLVRVLFGLTALGSCSAPPSNTIPDYSATRIKVNTASAQSASLDARSSAIEIKNSKDNIEKVSAQLEVLKEQIEASRMRLAR